MTENISNTDLNEEEAEVLKELEKMFGVPISQVEQIIWEDYQIDDFTHQMKIHKRHQFGYIIEDGKIIGLGLSTNASNVKNLKYPEKMPPLSKFKHLRKLDVNGWDKVFFAFLEEERSKKERYQKAITGNLHLSFAERQKERNEAMQIISRVSSKTSPFKLKAELKYMPNLQFLDITDCKFSDIKDLGILTNLLSLDLSDNEIKVIPDEFSALLNLETLILQRNPIETFSPAINEMKSLKRLDLTGTKISSLSTSIGNMTSLEELILPPNITEIPESYSGLKNLKTLETSTIPFNIGQFMQLESLSLIDSLIKEIPPMILDLHNLKSLEVSGCRNLTTLPDGFEKLKSLKSLSITGNPMLNSIPKSIYLLSNLEVLNLHNNKITEISDELGTMVYLENLDLSNNNLARLPYSIYKLNNIISFTIESNPLEKNDAIISGKTLPEIKAYCKKKMSINVFISHAVADFESCSIERLSQFLEEQIEINIAFFCERDLISNIDAFMDKNIPQSQLVLFIATPTSLNSQDCQYELKLAREYGVEIIPLKSTEVAWPDLNEIGLSRELGIEFNFSDSENLIEAYNGLYDYIKQMKRRIDLFDKQQAKIDILTVGVKSLERKIEELTKLLEDVDNRLKNMENKP